MKRSNRGEPEELAEARAAVSRAENAWRKAFNVHIRRHKIRLRTRAEESEADSAARMAYEAAGATLSAAREHLRFVLCTIPGAGRRDDVGSNDGE